MILDPRCADRADILAKPLDPPAQPAYTHTMQNDTPSQEGFAILTTLTLLLFTFAALASCGSSGGSTGTGSPVVPRYYADEPNDTWEQSVPINAEAPLYEVEGNIHHGDLDCIAIALPFPRTENIVDVSVDYAAGWDMEVQVGWIDATGSVTSVWGAYDAFGDGIHPTTVTVPETAGWLALSIRQTQTPLPDETRYTFTVEVF